MYDDLGWRFWGGLVGAIIAIGLGVFLFLVIFDRALYRWGAFGALIAVGAVLLVIGWIFDRRQVRRYEEE